MQIYEHSHEILNTSLDKIVLHISFSCNFCNMVKSIDIGKNLKQNKFKITASSAAEAAAEMAEEAATAAAAETAPSSPIPNFPFPNVRYRIN
jgi:hypothetical protein